MRTLQSQIGWCAKVQWVLAAAMLGLVGGFYLLAYRPAAGERAALRGQVQNTRRELEGNQARTQIKPIVEGKVKLSRAKLDRFDKRLPRHQELSQFIGDISQISRHSALRRWSTKMAPPKPSDDRSLVELPIHLSFEGDFGGVFAFLRQMDQMPRLTRIRQLELKSKPGGAGEVEVQLSLAIYSAEGG